MDSIKGGVWRLCDGWHPAADCEVFDDNCGWSDQYGYHVTCRYQTGWYTCTLSITPNWCSNILNYPCAELWTATYDGQGNPCGILRHHVEWCERLACGGGGGCP